MYETVEEVEFENHWTPLIMNMPLLSKKSAVAMDLKPIKKITKKLKSGFGQIYAMYLLTWACAAFIPRMLLTWMIWNNTTGFTAALSNVRGPAKPMFVVSKDKGEKSFINYYCGYIGATGNLGLTMFGMSINGRMAFSLTSDDNVADEALNQRILAKTVAVMREELEEMKRDPLWAASPSSGVDLIKAESKKDL